MEKPIFEMNKFHNLSLNAKLLLLSSYSFKKDLGKEKNYPFFCKIIGLSLPNDELSFHYYLSEITNAKIKYSIENIRFKPPTHDDCNNFLNILGNKLKKILTSEQKSTLVDNFILYFNNNNWKIGKNRVQMVDWKQALIYAANNWTFRTNTINNDLQSEKTTFSVLDNVFNDF